MLSHQQKLDFVLKMTKHALSSVQHFDAGGTVINGASPTATSGAAATSQGSIASMPQFVASGVTNPIGSAGQSAQNIAQDFTAQNQYSANLAPTTSINYNLPVDAAYAGINQGYGENENLLGEERQLGNQLQSESLGKGPNPAQAALNQNTGQNISQAAALAAGVRGAGTNAGLIAQNSAQQGAATQQNAVGQEATLQAQQQLNAQQQLQAQQTAEQNTIQGEQSINGNLFGAAANANNAQNNTAVSNYAQAQGINSQVAQNNANAVNKTTSGLLGGAGALAALFAEGGKVPPHFHKMAKIYYPHLMATGGSVDFGVPNAIAPSITSPNFTSSDNSSGSSGSNLSDNAASGVTAIGGLLARGGKVRDMKSGGKVPGKPKVNHDAYSNDTADAKLTPGEVVIDLDTLHDKGKLGQMARFVAANIERRKAGRKL